MPILKRDKWAHMLPNMLAQIEAKLQAGWEVAYIDGSKDQKDGVDFAGYGVWFAEGDVRNEHGPNPIPERQSITRAELRAALALRALSQKCLGRPLHLVTDLELVFVGLTSTCQKWERNKWVESQGPLAQTDLWIRLWEQWQLYGDSVSIQ